MRPAFLSLPLLCAAVFLTGCGFTADTNTPVNPGSKSVHGKIMGGQQPVVGSTVTVYALGTGGANATALASTTTDQFGNFAFNTTPDNTYTCPVGPIVPDAAAKGARFAAHEAKSEPVFNKGKITKIGTPAVAKAHARPAALPDLTQAYVYITAAGGDSGGGSNSSILLVAGLGACTDAQSESVEINEVSTVVFANAMQNYSLGFGNYGTNGTSYEAISAMYMAETNTVQAFVDLSTGLVKPNVTSSDAGGTSITIDAAKIYSLANIIGSCVNSADVTTTPSSPQPSQACTNLYASLSSGVANTLDAATQIAFTPYDNVAGLFALPSSKPPFAGGLPAAPNDWTIGISYTTSAMGLGLFPAADGSPTSSNIDIDSSGRVWFPSDKSGAIGVGYFDPTETTFSGPFGGNYLTQPQYLALDDQAQRAVVTDVASNSLILVDTTPGGVNAVTALSYDDGLEGSQPNAEGPVFVNSDSSFNFALTDTLGGYDMIYVDPILAGGGSVGSFVQSPTGLTVNTTLGEDPDDPANPIGVAATSGPSTACSLEVAGSPPFQGSLPAPFSTATNPCVSGGAATAALLTNVNGDPAQDQLTTATTANAFCSQIQGGCIVPSVEQNGGAGPTVNLASGPAGIAFDGGSEVWLANSGNASIAALTVLPADGPAIAGMYYAFADRPYLHDQANGGTMISPAGIAIDGAGDIWVSNATCISTTDTTCSFTLSEVLGAGFPTITPLASQANQLQGTVPDVAGRSSTARMKSLIKNASKKHLLNKQ